MNLNYRLYSNGLINKKVPESITDVITQDHLEIKDKLLIDKVEVIINKLNHTWVGDIKMKLKSSTDSITLMNSPGSGTWGSSEDDFRNLILSDTSNISIENIDNYLSPISGNFKPLEKIIGFQ